MKEFELPHLNTILDNITQWILSNGLKIVVILFFIFVGLRIAKLVTGRIIEWIPQRNANNDEYAKRTDTLKGIIHKTLSTLIVSIGVVMLLSQIGVKIGPILAAAGVVGLAVGFGAQKLVEDVISGFFILIEDQIRVGDVVAIVDKSGLVERVDLRMVVLRDLSGNVHFVRNGQIDVVTNMTKDYSRYVFDIGVAYRENVDDVIAVIKETDRELREDPNYKNSILEPIEVLGLDKFDESAIVIKARTKTKPIKQWEIAREFNRRLKKKFDEKNIEIPFPHRTIYMGQDKKGHSPNLNINNVTNAKN